MGAAAPAHPDIQTLQSYGFGELDDALAASVKTHLESCSDCRRRVAEESCDSSIGREQGAEDHADPAGSTASSDTWLSMLGDNASRAARSLADTLPNGLVDHADYDVIRELGQGAMGTVYLAQNRLMGRREVLKVVSSHLIQRRGVMDRFLTEIRNAARLHHTNIVTAYTAIRLGESIIFAMEYVDGLDLAKLVKAKGPLAVANACSYAHQAALGLQHAHEHGMVHRDIKPSNLILAPQGGRAVIKILDFGLAKIQSEGPTDSGLTHEGQMLGTPDFVAPEQIGDARRADIRADIYSLGCTLYYLLTGGPPFKSTNLYQILQAHHSMDAPPLYVARPDVPPELAALVARMMAKDPESRFETPKEVALALKPFFKAAALRDLKPELSFPGSPDVVGDPGAPVLHPETNKPALLSDSKPLAHLSGAGAAWERLIDLGEPDSLTESAPVIPAPTRPTPPWPIYIGLSIVGIATLAAFVGYMTATHDRNASVVGRAQTRVAQSPNASSRNLASNEETSDFTQADSSFGSPTPVGQRDPVNSPSNNSDDSMKRLSMPAAQKATSGTLAPSASQVRVDTPEQAPLIPELKPEAGSQVSAARILTPEERLQKFGLTRANKVYIVAQEAELEQEFKRSRPLMKEFQSNCEMRIKIQMASARIHQLDQFIPEIDFNIRSYNVQLGARPARPNSDQIAFFDDIKQRRDMLGQERSQAIAELQILRSQIPIPRQIHELDLASQRGRASCRRAVDGLGEMIKSIDAKFGELKKNDELQQALADAGGTKFAHASDYPNLVKQVKQWDAFLKAVDQRMETKTEPVSKKNSGMRKR
jgi:serine/threonine protein kinase